MIRYLWVDKNAIYNNITEDRALKLLGEDLDRAKILVLNTINWRTGDYIKNNIGGNTKLSAVNSKLISLLAKLINDLNPDLNILTETEKNIFTNLLTMSENGYSDSNLALNTTELVLEALNNSELLISEVNNAESVSDLINILEKIK